ncbi:unnamed protein product [Thlaspi arvense]|uniref:MADS-box domain-containing protein n=1 Tax=Thlaspi arvense TaxID=13288 RepID=A0AAU9RJZ6_THLAR|nr:unnamed protein product [Thlaspi arvense]
MTRQKVKMAFIENETSRKSTFKKRKRGLLKKAYELQTLCDVPIAIMIDSAYDSSPEVWPTTEKVDRIVSHWKTMSPMDKSKKMMNQETFLQQRIYKATESCKKLRKENREMAMKEVMFSCLSGEHSVTRIDKNDLRDFGFVVEQHLKDLNRRIEILKKNGETLPSSPAAAAVVPTTPDVVVATVEMATSTVGFYDEVRGQIKDSLNIKQTVKDLDLNKEQW